jgi:hypothetical protein
MNTRLILSLLCAGAVAYACGPRSRSESGTVASLPPLQLTNKVDLSPKRGPSATAAKKTEAKIDSRLNVDVAANEVRFAFNVTNVGKKHVELSFPSGQSYDFVVVDSLGREVWHWSTGRMFTQGVQNKQLGTGDVMHVSEAWKHPAQRGRYTAIATLHSSNYPLKQVADFTLP